MKPTQSAWLRDTDIKHTGVAALSWMSSLYLAYSSIGVIYGDLCTSPLYAYPSIFADFTPTKEDILQATSLTFWSLTLVPLIKYVLVVIYANDNGEGGTFAVYTLLCRTIGVSPYGKLHTAEHRQLLALTPQPPHTLRSRSTPASGLHPDHHTTGGIASSDVSGGTASAGTYGSGVCSIGGIPLHALSPRRGPGAAPAQPQQQKSPVKELRWWNAFSLDGHRMRSWFRRQAFAQKLLLGVTMLGTSMLIGDGVLTPSISVVSAISGLEIASPQVTSKMVVGVSVAIIVLLFSVQGFGTQRISVLFSPIILLWLLSNSAIAIYNLTTYGGGIFAALSPHHIVNFFMTKGTTGWVLLGAVMLCLTGAEAMFADLGHFSVSAIHLSFCYCVYPAMVLIYMGIGSYLLEHPEDARDAYWTNVPKPIFYPMLVLATLASVVASQSLISGAFSIVRQAIMLGVFPKLRVHHTGEAVEGQVYLGAVNWTLMLLCIASIVGFEGDTVKLGQSMGLSVMCVMFITTCLVTLVMILKWELSVFIWLPFFLVFALIDGAYLSANLNKVQHGGWFTVAISAGILSVMVVWYLGTRRRREVVIRREMKQPRELFTITTSTDSTGTGTAFARTLQGHGAGSDCMVNVSRQSPSLALTTSPDRPLLRLPGLGLYYSDSPTGVPPVLCHFLRNLEAVHEVSVFVTVRVLPLPRVLPEERFLVRAVEGLPRMYQAVVRYGYQEKVQHGTDFVNSLICVIIERIEGEGERGPYEDHISAPEGLDEETEGGSPSCASHGCPSFAVEPDVETGSRELKPIHGASAAGAGAAGSADGDSAAAAYAAGSAAAGLGLDGVLMSPSSPHTGAIRLRQPSSCRKQQQGQQQHNHQQQQHTPRPLAAASKQALLDSPFAERVVPNVCLITNTMSALMRGAVLETLRPAPLSPAQAPAPATPRALWPAPAPASGVADVAKTPSRLGRAPTPGKELPQASIELGVAAAEGPDTANAREHRDQSYGAGLTGSQLQGALTPLYGLPEEDRQRDSVQRIAALMQAARTSVVYYFGATHVHVPQAASAWHRLLYGTLYRSLMAASWSATREWEVPVNNLLELGMVIYI